MLTLEGDLNLVTGEVTNGVVDAYVPRCPAVSFVRLYSSRNLSPGMLGYGWRHNLQLTLRREGEHYLLGGAGAGDDRFSQNAETGIFTTNSGGYILEFDAPFTLVRSRNGSFWRFEPHSSSSELRVHSREDVNGNRIQYFYSGGMLVGILGRSDRRLSLSYDARGRLIGLVFSHPSLPSDVKLVTYGYDSHGDLVQVSDRSGVPVQYEYSRHVLVAITNRKGGRTYFAYDAAGAGVARWRSDGGRYEYFRRDRGGRRIEMTNSRGDRWIFTVDESGNVTRRVDPLRRIHENVYDPNGGLLMSDMEPNVVPCISIADETARTETVVCAGKETKITYNAFDKPVLVEAPEGNLTAFRYDDRGHVIEIAGADGTAAQFRYSAAGDVISLSDPRGNETHWDVMGFGTQCWDLIGPLGASAVDAFGNLDHVADPYGNVTRLAYDPAGRLGEAVFPDGGRQRFGYDAAGYPRDAQYENGSKAEFESDVFGRPTGYADPNGNRYSLSWDPEDKLTRVVNPAGESLLFSYDACNRITGVTHYDGRATVVENDDRDRPTRYINVNSGVETSKRFNDEGLIQSRTATNAPSWEFEYGPNGQLAGAASELGQWREKWSKRGRWIGEDAPDRSLDIERDAIGRRVRLRDNYGLKIDYVWDVRSRLRELRVNDTWSWKFEYDLRDLIIRAETPGNLILSFAYDRMQRMLERRLTAEGGGILAARRFVWSLNDDLLRVEDLRFGVRTMTVDAGGRLLAIRGSVNEDYAHDALGNVLTTVTGEAIRIGSGCRVLSTGASRFVYSDEGHIVQQTSPNDVTAYEYDGDGLLKSVTLPSGEVVENEYDFLARRVRKTFAGQETSFYWDGRFLQGEKTGTASPTYYITLPESPIPLGLLRDGRMHILLFDQIGTVTEAFDETGRPTWAADYTAFGSIRTEAGALPQPIRALGQYHDRETGLYYNWFRHYAPELGRYISADPAGYRYSQNPYWYSSNPHSWVDYDGRGSLSGGVLTLNWRCDWTTTQKEDFVSKIAAQNAHLALNGPFEVDAAKSYKRPCGTAADKWRDECEKNASDAEKKRPVKNTGDPCKDNDADHRMELCLGGENECHNMTPCNASVNRSCGSQIGKVLRDPANAGGSVTEIEPAASCTPPGGDTKPCTANWSSSAKLPE